MQEINIAKILTNKRRDRGITQEELADYMGVSKAAVSKWEQSQSYPDITLLPRLAAYFNISVDELLDYSPQLSREDSRKLCKRLSAKFTDKPFDHAMTECREIIKKYYACFPLLYQIAVMFINHSAASPKEQKDEFLHEAKALCRRIVSESGDALLARDAVYIQCYCALMLESPDEVFALLGETFNTPDVPEDNLLAQAFQLANKPEKAKEIAQCGMYQYLLCLIETTLLYAGMTEENFDTSQVALERAMTLIDLYGVGKLNANTLAKAYLIGANLYCRHDFRDKALELLEQYADLCVGVFLPFKLCGDDFFTDVDEWLDSGQLGATIHYDEKMLKENMLCSMTDIETFAVLQDEPRYRSIVQKITDFIIKGNEGRDRAPSVMAE